MSELRIPGLPARWAASLLAPQLLRRCTPSAFQVAALTGSFPLCVTGGMPQCMLRAAGPCSQSHMPPGRRVEKLGSCCVGICKFCDSLLCLSLQFHIQAHLWTPENSLEPPNICFFTKGGHKECFSLWAIMI